MRCTPALCIKDLAIDGTDLIKAGVTPGPKIGEILNALLEAVLEDPSENNKDELMKLAGF